MANLEERVHTLEHSQAEQSARLRDLQRDMTGSFAHVELALVQTEQRLDARLDELKSDIATVKTDVAAVKSSIAGIEANITAVEGRILDAFKQLINLVDARLPPAQKSGE